MDKARADWQDKALWAVRIKRDSAANSVPEWEQLRNQASQIKENVLSNLDTYLLQFEEEAKQNGAKVYWTNDAADFNRIVLKIIRENDHVDDFVHIRDFSSPIFKGLQPEHFRMWNTNCKPFRI